VGRPALALQCFRAALKVNQDDQLLRAVQKMGRNWKTIRDQSFLGRSRNDVKNRHTILIRRGSSSTSTTLAKRKTLHFESDEEEDRNTFANDIEEEDNEEEDDDDDEEDGDDNNDNTNNEDDDDILKTNIDSVAEGIGQDIMGLGQCILPFSNFDFSAGTASMSPTEHAFSFPFSMSDTMELDTGTAEHDYPFEAIPNHFYLPTTNDIEQIVGSAPGSVPSTFSYTAPVSEDSMLTQSPHQPQTPKLPTYKRVTLVLEDYEKGLMDQLLQIVSTSQGKSQIEIMP
jgi:hypothetical protein